MRHLAWEREAIHLCDWRSKQQMIQDKQCMPLTLKTIEAISHKDQKKNRSASPSGLPFRKGFGFKFSKLPSLLDVI